MNIKNKIKSNKGASGTIEFIFYILFYILLLGTTLDLGFYFVNRNIITNSAQNGARLAAIYGGASDTPIAKQYGTTSVTSDCLAVNANNPVSCSVFNELINTKGVTNVELLDIDCGPNLTKNIGDRTYCSIKWKFNGLSSSAIGISKLFSTQETRMTAESEVVSK